VNKGILIGIIIAVTIIAGGIVLAQENSESETTVIETSIENEETKSKNFEVGLSESIGMTENP